MAWMKLAQRETDEDLGRAVKEQRQRLRELSREAEGWRAVAGWLGKRMRRLERQLDKQGEP